ncbi:YigZ family protein [Helicobacter sp. faydin-H20]|uniref:YigZ family protein n=1 Tax=Helicobacter anatolicus TaxID=2905874 RepID=UPI001E4F15D2|nr:YigZ family protein [Helicobacter anatolicus]MCE3036363.1 YigZ family protein [Helicobacter anatolicus]
MKKIVQEVYSSNEIKKSIFLGFLLPYTNFVTKMQKLKDEHPKAVHFVYAYRIYEDGKVVERFSDDGEPKGSSGMPVLNVLRGRDLVDCAAIVVRYFGGTLLGVGGLVRAYTQSVVDCIKEAEKSLLLDEFLLEESCEICCQYTLLGKVEYLAKKLALRMEKKTFEADGVVIVLMGERKGLDIFRQEFSTMQFNLKGE